MSTSARPFHPHSGPDREAAHRNPGAWRALRETAEALGSADPAEGLDHAVRAAMTLLDADGAGLTLVVGEGRDGTAIPAAVGALAPFHGQTGPLAGTLSEHVLAVGEPRALDTESPDAPSGAAMMARLGLVHLALAPLRAGGEALGTLGVARRRGRAPFTTRDLDVLAVLAAQAALAVRCARAQEGALAASVAKSEFLAVMSHELRTPLNALSGYAALLEEGIFGPVNDGQRGALARMRAARDQLVGLVEQVLDMARVEAGSKEVHREEVELDAVVAGVAGTLAGAAARKGLALEVDAPPGLRLHTDGWMVRQIVSHLVDNAIKFTARGVVSVRAWAGAGGVAVEVADTGQGIAAGYHERIFEPFFQVDASTTRQEGGMGLGLAVAREFARLLGGEVSVRSAPGDGSVFVLSLPG